MALIKHYVLLGELLGELKKSSYIYSNPSFETTPPKTSEPCSRIRKCVNCKYTQAINRELQGRVTTRVMLKFSWYVHNERNPGSILNANMIFNKQNHIFVVICVGVWELNTIIKDNFSLQWN